MTMPIMDLLFSFKGRIRRSQYWLTALVAGIVFAVLINVIVGFTVASNPGAFEQGQLPPVFWIGMALAYIPLMWISLALAIKRWHDRDKSGWWVLIGLIPIVGGIWTLIECGFLDGTQGPNKFGPSPKGLNAPERAF
jgi:uncharacterized membrane protein YhaH (DUF805 family)